MSRDTRRYNINLKYGGRVEVWGSLHATKEEQKEKKDEEPQLKKFLWPIMFIFFSLFSLQIYLQVSFYYFSFSLDCIVTEKEIINKNIFCLKKYCVNDHF